MHNVIRSDMLFNKTTIKKIKMIDHEKKVSPPAMDYCHKHRYVMNPLIGNNIMV